MKAVENDYISILAELGKECLGAIKIIEGKDEAPSGYELLETHLSLTGSIGKVGLYYYAADDLASKGFENAITMRDAILESSKNRLA